MANSLLDELARIKGLVSELGILTCEIQITNVASYGAVQQTQDTQEEEINDGLKPAMEKLEVQGVGVVK